MRKVREHYARAAGLYFARLAMGDLFTEDIPVESSAQTPNKFAVRCAIVLFLGQRICTYCNGRCLRNNRLDQTRSRASTKRLHASP